MEGLSSIPKKRGKVFGASVRQTSSFAKKRRRISLIQSSIEGEYCNATGHVGTS